MQRLVTAVLNHIRKWFGQRERAIAKPVVAFRNLQRAKDGGVYPSASKTVVRVIFGPDVREIVEVKEKD